MDNQEPYLETSAADNDFTSKGVLNSNLRTEDICTLSAAPSENASTSISETSSAQHVPCAYQTEGVEPNAESQSTQLSSDFSSRHFLKRDFASSEEQIMFEFFFDLYGNEAIAKICIKQQMSL